MSYKWRPSKSQARAFAERMKDPAEAAAYNDRKATKAAKRRAGSSFNVPYGEWEKIPRLQAKTSV